MKLQATLDDTDKKILELLCEGYIPKEIAHKLWKSAPSIHKRLKTLRDHFKVKTTLELIATYVKQRA